MASPGQGIPPAPPSGEEEGRLRLLDAVLARLPFGLKVSAEGETVYASNTLAEGAAAEADPDRHFRTRLFQAGVDGTDYDVALTLDDTDAVRAEQELVRRAYFDELTGLPNRALAERSVNALIASQDASLALAFIDLDGFKHVNDYYGHAVGDQLLARLAQRIDATLRPSDMLARLGGDEFLLLISPVADARSLADEIEWLAERIKDPFLIDGHEIFASASVGVATYPRDGRDYETLRASADRAMYLGKSSAKGTVRFFDAAMEHGAAERSRLEQRVRVAIRDRRVRCVYQPKVDLRSGEVSGVEVLMRWVDEDGIIQPPGDFLTLATELGLMNDLTRFVLAEAIGSIDAINDTFGPGCTVSVNVAARQAGDYAFMRSLAEVLEGTTFADRFMIELTEEAFIAKEHFQRRILPMLRQTGARISIDDFGIGYSSLSALADITADEVKVDRAFITEIHRRPRSQSILKAIEALGHSLGMTVVVEGVETFEELAYLQAATRINYGQGYYFSKPMLLSEAGAAASPDKRDRQAWSARERQPTRLAGNVARSA